MASFKEAFAAARKAQGAGGEFTWKGKSYSTNIVGETGKKKKLSFSTDMAEKAIDKASGIQTPDASTPRPPRRPTEIATSIDVSDGGIKVTKLPYEATSLAGRAGSALGTYIGRQMAGPTKLDKLKSEAADQTNRSKVNQGAKELMTGRKGAAAQYKEGGVVKMKEGSAKDMREDKAMAKKHGMTMKQHEASAADKKHDAPKKMAGGGIVKMKKGGTPLSSTELKKLNLNTGMKKVDERDAKFATYADRGTSGRDAGLKEATERLNDLRATYKGSKDLIERYGTDAPKARGFMAYEGQSGTAKKKAMGRAVKKTPIPGTVSSSSGSPKLLSHPFDESKYQGDLTRRSGGGVVKKAGGGSMRGAGCAVRGKGFSGSY